MVTIEVKGVSCSYDSVPILDNVKFLVNPGEFLGIMGPNGSGKTTLLRTVSRFLKPPIGAVLLDDVDVHSMRQIEVAKQVAVVPQDSSVGFNFTAMEVVLMGRNPHLGPFQMESSRDLQIARQAMRLTNCLSLSDRRVNELSGGERRRVIIARALAQEPQVLLLDEPTLNLDVNNQIELMDVILRLSKEMGLVVLSVFHDFNLAARYSDKILLLRDGKVFSMGTPEDVLTEQGIRAVFKVNAEVTKHPVNRLSVTILSAASGEQLLSYVEG